MNNPKLIFLGGLGNYRNIKLSGKNLSREYHGGNRVYDSDGIAQTLTAQSLGGYGGHSGLYLVDETMDEEIKLKRLGNLNGYTGGSFAYTVYNPEGLCPPITTCEGGGREPMIVEPISTNGSDISGTIRSTYYKNGTRNIEKNLEGGLGYEGVIEPQVLTTKRNEYGKQIRKSYENHEIYEQRSNMTEYEPRTDGIANTITTVLKDNYVIESEYASCAIRGRNPENPSDRSIGILTEQRLEPSKEPDVSNCITSVQKDSLLLENKEVVGGLYYNASPNFDHGVLPGLSRCIKADSHPVAVMEEDVVMIQNSHGFNKGNTHDVAPAVTSNSYQENNFVTNINKDPTDDSQHGIRYRIRKLTPKETWRVMGFKDEDFEKAAEISSNTALYKMAGNSIVRNVLMAIFGQMFEGKENVYKKWQTI